MRLFIATCFALGLAAAPPPDPTECVACHDTINLERFRTRTHGKLGCVTCHTAITTLPHAEKLPQPQCVRCHDHEGQDYATSVHGVARKQGKEHAPTCTTCHGHAHEVVPRNHPDSKVARKNMDATCGKCHDQAFLKVLSTRLPHRASRMDLQKMPGKK
jgi:hypothetical protein